MSEENKNHPLSDEELSKINSSALGLGKLGEWKTNKNSIQTRIFPFITNPLHTQPPFLLHHHQ